MIGTAVTRIGDQNFRILGCQQVAELTKSETILQESNIKEMLVPLSWENCDEAFVQSVESQIRDFIFHLATQPDGITTKDIKSDNNPDNEGYKMLFHKAKSIMFGFLVYPLSDSEMKEIEENSTGKTYLTGGPEGMFKKKEEFN